MVKAVWGEFQGRFPLVYRLQILIFALFLRDLYSHWSERSTYQWRLNCLALTDSLFRLVNANAELICFPTVWRP